MVILCDTQGTMNPGDIPLSQDYTLGQHQTLTYTTQVEVGSPIVSSTSHPESDNPGLSMVQVRGSSCSARQNTDNIGSIITMLIDDQNVDIEEILTEEQYRQDSQLAGQARTLNQVMGPGQTDIQDRAADKGRNANIVRPSRSHRILLHTIRILVSQ